jgi:hypothetical protein
VNRRQLLKNLAILTGTLLKDSFAVAQTQSTQTPGKWSYSSLKWKSISNGLDFATVDVNRGKEIVDSLAV